MREEELLAYLRALYEGAGFRAYKMRKFEEYALYLENRDFLNSEAIIAFSDLSGHLLALKPDVTLSIVKGTRATGACGEKLYYTESVYRLDARTREYREIRQMGLESLGAIDGVQTAEVCALALESLIAIDPEAVMDISHMGYVGACLADIGPMARKRALDALRGKSASALAEALKGEALPGACMQRLEALLSLDGDFSSGLETLARMARTEDEHKAVRELDELRRALAALGLGARARLDFSIASDLSYYTGIAFQGYVRASHRAVLCGGRYDGLAQKFKRGVGALGFAIYLSDLPPDPPRADADALLVYAPGQSPENVMRAAQKLRAQGLRVRVEARAPQGIAYGRTEEVKGEC